jgi:hypothetical protein
MPGWVILLLVLAALYALHRLLRWMESRGWIYWTKSSGASTRAGNAMLEIQQLLEPSKKHVIEMKREDKKKSDASGDPPNPE